MEDIERIQNLINIYKIFSNVPIEENDIKALENIVKDYKDLHLAYELYKSKYEKLESVIKNKIDKYELYKKETSITLLREVFGSKVDVLQELLKEGKG